MGYEVIGKPMFDKLVVAAKSRYEASDIVRAILDELHIEYKPPAVSVLCFHCGITNIEISDPIHDNCGCCGERFGTHPRARLE